MEVVKVENINPQVDRFVSSDGHGVVNLLLLFDLLKNWMETEKYENEFAFGRSALLLGHAAQDLATVLTGWAASAGVSSPGHGGSSGLNGLGTGSLGLTVESNRLGCSSPPMQTLPVGPWLEQDHSQSWVT